MKNKALIIICTLVQLNFGLLSAQTTKGNVLLGGSTIIDHTWFRTNTSMNLAWTIVKTKSDSGDEDNSDPDKVFSINLTPRIGYFIFDNFASGLDFTLGFSRAITGGGDNVMNATLMGVGPFLRYYFPTQKLLPFVEAQYSIGSAKYDWDFVSDQGETHTFWQQYGISIGLGIPLGDKVSFDTQIGYLSNMQKAKEDNEDNYRQIVGTIGLKLGMSITL